MKFRKEFGRVLDQLKFLMSNIGVLQLKDQKYFDIGDFLVRPILIKSIAIIKRQRNCTFERKTTSSKNFESDNASNEVIIGKLDGTFH